jgi:hypothetical protein
MGRSVLHHCVSRNYFSLVNYLTGGSTRWKSSDPNQRELLSTCEKLFKGIIKLDVQYVFLILCFLMNRPRDVNGDTPIHLASRVGNQEIVEALCDAGADSDTLKNKKSKIDLIIFSLFSDETAADIARTQAIFQILKLAAARRDAERELKEIHHSRIMFEKHPHRYSILHPQSPSGGKGSRPSSRSEKERNVLQPVSHRENDEDAVSASPKPTSHSYWIGYLPPEKEPPPFKGNFKKKAGTTL